jgi:periplasmic mercuric ion binding protein
MKKALYVIILGLPIIFWACNSETKTEAPKPRPLPTMSEHTEISAAPADNIRESTIKIPTAVCKTCEAAITKAVNNVDGVTDVKVSAKGHTAKVKFDAGKTTLLKIQTAISKAGYDADNIKRDSKAYDKLPSCCKAG